MGRRAEIRDKQKALMEKAVERPAVPPMEQLIHQAVANNSREIELTKRAEQAEARARIAEAERSRVQDVLVASQKETIEVYRKLTLAMEEINLLKDRNER